MPITRGIASCVIPILVSPPEENVKHPWPVLALAFAAVATPAFAQEEEVPMVTIEPDSTHHALVELPPEFPFEFDAPPAIAPDFQFESADGGWKHLHDLCAKGHVLLIFAPDDRQLKALEHDADSLRARGIEPVGVIPLRDRDGWRAIDRLGLSFRLISDPRNQVASQFWVRDGAAGHDLKGWCLVNSDRRVVGIERGALPESDFFALAMSALQPRERALALPR